MTINAGSNKKLIPRKFYIRFGIVTEVAFNFEVKLDFN